MELTAWRRDRFSAAGGPSSEVMSPTVRTGTRVGCGAGSSSLAVSDWSRAVVRAFVYLSSEYHPIVSSS